MKNCSRQLSVTYAKRVLMSCARHAEFSTEYWLKVIYIYDPSNDAIVDDIEWHFGRLTSKVGAVSIHRARQHLTVPLAQRIDQSWTRLRITSRRFRVWAVPSLASSRPQPTTFLYRSSFDEHWVNFTLSLPIQFRLYRLPYWSNPPFLIFDIWALWRSGLSARAPRCQKLKMVG